MQEPFVIHNQTIEPGEDRIIQINVGRLPSDTKIHINVHVYRSGEPGPTALILAGVHGDEINGVETVRRLVADRFFERLKRGNAIVIPLLNIYGFINFSREVPDGKDVNRSFPGSQSGSLAARVARTLTKKVLPIIDFGVDFHTGGNSLYNFPQIRYTKGDQQAKEMAEAFAAPFTIVKRPIPKSLRKVASDAKKPVIIYEGGESLRFDGFAIEKGLIGLKRLLHSMDMLDGDFPAEESLHFERSSWLRASRAGLFRWSKRSGHAVLKGEPLGVINDPYGTDEIPIVAKRDGYIIGHNNAPVVSTGDALFHIGY
jgi:predicted deacylase